LNLDDRVRNDLLRLPENKLMDVAAFCNSYPNVDVKYEVKEADDIAAGDVITMLIDLDRDIDDDDSEIGIVSSLHFPFRKKESWWIVIGDTSNNSLLALKRVSLKDKLSIKLEFTAPEEPGDHNLTLFCMSDSYMGCDQEYSINISVAPAADDGESSSSED
jgi:pre-mRNA-splicing helicase BRR2